MVNGLNKVSRNKYPDWLHLSMILSKFGQFGEKLLIDFSKSSPSYDIKEIQKNTIKFYESLDGFSFLTLLQFYKEDQPKTFKDFFKNNKKIIDILTDTDKKRRIQYLEEMYDKKDEGLVKLYYNSFKDKLVYVGNNTFYKYNETKKLWEEKNDEHIITHFVFEMKVLIKPLHEHYSLLATRMTKNSKELLKKAKQIKTDKKITEASSVKGFLCIIHTIFENKEFLPKLDNSDKDTLPVKGGVISLRTGVFRERTINDFYTFELNVEWKGLDYKTDTIDRFMKDIMLDSQEMVDYLQVLLGYSITGYVLEQIFILLVGPGSNGKGVLMSQMKHLMGKYFRQCKGELVIQGIKSNDGAASPHIMQLMGARVAFVDENEAEAKLNESVVKNITGGASITARPLFKDNVTFDPTFQLFLLTNHKPKLNVNNSTQRRIVVIPFLSEYKSKENMDPTNKNHKLKNNNIEEELKAKLDEFLVWLVRGSIKYFKDGLGKTPELAKHAVDEYMEENDDIASMIENHCDKVKGEAVSHKMLYNLFISEYRLVSQKVFTGLMRDKGYISSKSRAGMQFEGLQLKDDELDYDSN